MTGGDEALVRIRNLSKTYARKGGDGVQALTDIDFDIRSGEILSLIGPSGCGKSSLLRILAGLDTGYDGDVTWTEQPEQGRDIGFVFQDASLLPWRTVLRNVCLGLEGKGISKSDRESRGRELLELVGLQDFAAAYPRELSGGMRQRVAIVRALAYDPKVLLMDEPFGALDAITRDTLQDDLLRIWEATRKTIIIVTHSVEEAAYLSDRVVVLTARPGTVASIETVPLDRERTPQTRERPEFAAFAGELRSGLSS